MHTITIGELEAMNLKKKVNNIWEGLEEEKEREMLLLYYNLKNKIKVFIFNLYILLM